jgi:hypothetical protein
MTISSPTERLELEFVATTLGVDLFEADAQFRGGVSISTEPAASAGGGVATHRRARRGHRARNYLLIDLLHGRRLNFISSPCSHTISVAVRVVSPWPLLVLVKAMVAL